MSSHCSKGHFNLISLRIGIKVVSWNILKLFLELFRHVGHSTMCVSIHFAQNLCSHSGRFSQLLYLLLNPLGFSIKSLQIEQMHSDHTCRINDLQNSLSVSVPSEPGV